MVLGLIGENGSGKSTLLRVLSGQIAPDAGTIGIHGQAVRLPSPHAALKHGVAMVSQETSVAPELSVAENIFLGGRMARNRLGIDWRATATDAGGLMDQVGLDCSPDATVRSLRPDQRQLVEIARALSFHSRIVILDEPTSSLTEGEVAALYTIIRRLTGQGISAIFVSHKLVELFEIADQIAVLRDGSTVAEGPSASFTPDSLVEAMVSRPVSAAPQRRSARRVPTADRALEVDGLTATGAVRNVSLFAGRGEIVGLAGLEGCGRSELLQAIFGARGRQGRIVIDGTALRSHKPAAAIRRGMGYVPADRKSQGLVLSMSVHDNLNMVTTGKLPRLKRPRRAREAAHLREVALQTRLKAGSGLVLAGNLSGGNQQKVVLGKWLAAKPSVLLLDEPTRGVDVAAKADIYALLKVAAQNGMTMLVSSSEGSELREMCDRVLVMSRGTVVKSLPVDEATDTAMARYAGGLV